MQQGNRGRGGGGRGGGGRGGGRTPQAIERDKQRELRLTGLVRSVVSGDTLIIMDLSSDKSKNATPTDFYLTFIGLKAPVLGKKQMKDGKVHPVDDQEFAWQSREYLRNLLIGQVVVYRVEHELESRPGELKRKFGEVWLNNVNVRMDVVGLGWAKATPKESKAKEGKEAPKLRKDDEELQALEAKAQKEKIGIWSADKRKAVRAVRYRDNATPEEQFAFFEKLKGKPCTAVVEQVRTGSTLRLYLPETQDEITVMLSGVRSPLYKFNDIVASEPFSLEAKIFTEYKLWNRTVSVVLDGLDKFNFFATVTWSDKKLNVAKDLLEMGLAFFVEWSVANKADIQALKDCENKAKNQKLRVWKDHAAPAKKENSSQQPASQKHLTGQVVEVVNAGSIIVRITKGNRVDDYKLSFSSIKVPALPSKKGPKKGQPQRDNKLGKDGKPKSAAELELEAKKKKEDEEIDAAWALDAKDHLRKILVGKQVTCVWDYVRPVQNGEGQEWRQFHSIYLGTQNVGLQLVQLGYADVIHHADDETRSPEWKDMVLAERAAIAGGLKKHGARSAAPLFRMRNNDLTQNEFYGRAGDKQQKPKKDDAPDTKDSKPAEGKPKADPMRNKSFADELKKEKHAAVVDYVVSASRFKITIPKKGYILTLSLSAIRADPKEKVEDKSEKDQSNMSRLYPLASKDGKALPGNVAFHFTRGALFQRDVTVAIEGCDQHGTFTGKLWVQQGGQAVDWGLKLLTEGHAALSDYAPNIISDKQLLANYEKAEIAAQDAHKNRWVDFDRADADKKKAEAAAARQKKNDFTDDVVYDAEKVTVTEILSGSSFFYQLASASTEAALADLESAFASGDFDGKPEYTPKEIERGRGAEKEKVAGKFTVDGKWYRAEVVKILSKGKDKPHYELRYIDFGNSEVVPAGNIRQLPEALAKVNGGKGLATQARLAHTQAPALDDDYGRDSAAFFKELVWGRTMRANIHNLRYSDEGVRQVTLGDESGTTVSGLLVKEGLARVDKYGPKAKASAKLTEFQILKEIEEEAKKDHINIWQYGALPDSDDERAFQNQLR